MSKKLILAVLLLALASLGVPAQEKITALNGQERSAAIDKIAALLDRFYVFPDVAARLGAHIKARRDAGAFDRLADPKSFAEAVTRDLRSICKDPHLELYFGPNPDLQPKEDLALKRLLSRLDRERRNFGLNKVEILPGNVGYMSIQSVMYYDQVKDILEAALAFLSRTDALIFDLRDNGGGDAAYMAYLFSHFFDQPTHLNSIYWRDRDRTVESWTRGDVPGPKMADVPLFVVINRGTFSGAEEFAYDLQSRKRAVIVGETSRGGANPASSFVVYKDLRISIPLGRAINPVTGTNWEGVGVQPDVKAPAETALAAAAELAREAARTHGEAKKSRLLARWDACRESLAEAEKLLAANEVKPAEALVESALKKAAADGLLGQADINRMGYDALEQKKTRLAIALFKANVSAFPDSANAYDSLGEAYRRSGDKDRARESYTKALALNPRLESSRRALQELER